MIKVCVEVRQDDALSRVVVSADSISQAVSITKDHHPDRDVRVVFPIDTEVFFGGRAQSERDAVQDGGQLRFLPDRVGRQA